MNRTWMMVALTVVGAALAGGSASLVLGQQQPVGPPPTSTVTVSAPGQPAQPAPSAANQPIVVESKAPLVSVAPVQPPPVAHPLPAVTPPAPESPGAVPVSENGAGRQEPAISLEWVGPSLARLNQPAVYHIVAKNVGNSAVHQVVVRYPAPSSVRIMGTEPRANAEGSTLMWDLGTLTPGQEKRIELQLVPEAKAQFNCQANVTFAATSTLRVHVHEPKLLVKAVAPPNVVLGDSATIALQVSNPGDGQADHVKVKALLPDGLEHARGKIIEVELGNLGAGESRTVQLVCATKSQGPQLVECVAVGDSGLQTQDSTKVDVVLPRLDLVLSGPHMRYLERPAAYTLKVTNPGSAAASNVSIVHQLPQGFKFTSASHGGRHDLTAHTVSWFIGDLTPGESREVTLEVIAAGMGEHKHVAFATAARGLKTESMVVTRVEGLSALMLEVVDTNDPVEVGAETAYEIRVVNSGSKMETNVELICTVPDKMEFRDAKCAAGCRAHLEGKDVIFEALPRLAPRADVQYRITVRGAAPGDLHFRARVRADGLAEPIQREECTKVYGDEPTPR